MTDLQAALGASQMDRLDEFVARRHELAALYDRELKELPLTRPQRDRHNRSALHLYVIRLRLDQTDRSHREVFEALRSAGIGVNLHYIPVHTQPWYRNMGFRDGDFPQAEAYYREAISLPMFSGLTDEQLFAVCAALKSILCAG